MVLQCGFFGVKLLPRLCDLFASIFMRGTMRYLVLAAAILHILATPATTEVRSYAADSASRDHALGGARSVAARRGLCGDIYRCHGRQLAKGLRRPALNHLKPPATSYARLDRARRVSTAHEYVRPEDVQRNDARRCALEDVDERRELL